MKYKYYLVILLLIKSSLAFSQPVPAGTEAQELVRIADLYSNMPYLSFNLRYTYADSLTWLNYTDSMSATCKISHGRSFVSNNEMEILKGTEYYVYVDKEDSLIIAGRRNEFESVFQMPLLDPVFREANVLSMNITEWDDSTWRFRAAFKPDSYYSFYEMMYDPETGLIRSINYHARNQTGDYSLPEDHVVCAFVYMTNYSTAGEDPVIFNENRYFYLLNGAMYLQPAWQQFQLQN